MSNILVLDMETYDPYIEEGLGSGWPFYSEGRLKILCYSYMISQDHTPRTSKNYDNLTVLVKNADIIVCHNASYDVGLLHALGVDYHNKTIVDTILLAKLHDNNRLDYSLDSLSLHLFNERKTSEKLGEVAQQLKLVKSKSQNPVTVAMRHMDKIYEAAPEIVEEYAKQDVHLTHKLYETLKKDVTLDQINFYSDLIKALIKARAKGVRVCKETSLKIHAQLGEIANTLSESISQIAPDVNVNSSKQLAEFFDKENVPYPRTDKGNPSITSDWLEECDHPLAKNLVSFRKYEKAIRDFIEPVVNGERDRVHPEVKIFGAAATGRMSCSNPNLQQIPKRDKDIGPLVRSIYLPEEGEQWYSLDFSSQEPRLQIHFAHLLGAPGTQDIVDQFKNNSKHDLHQQVADLANITRSEAKTINLGLAYGMGVAKLAFSLGLDFVEAKSLLNKYHKKVPFMEHLTSVCRVAMNERSFIKTVGNRKLKYDGMPHKAMNKLIQGSAADQTNTALVQMYREGIDFMFPIHDSIELSCNDINVVKRVKEIMETCVPLVVPSSTDVECGPTWGALQKLPL